MDDVPGAAEHAYRLAAGDGPRSAAALRSRLRRNANQPVRVITVGGTKSYTCEIEVNYIFHKELQIIGSNSATKHDLEVMMPLLDSGKLKIVVDREFPLSEAAEAHRYLESAKQFGKVILRVEH